MERLKIAEAMLAYRAKHKKKLSMTDIGLVVLPGVNRPEAYISMWNNGSKMSGLNLTRLRKLADKLECKPRDLGPLPAMAKMLGCEVKDLK